MGGEHKKVRSPVRRDQAESYLLTSLVAFGATVIVTRAFLELTGYPQIGNSVLHIAHALWGGLLLFVAAFLPLALANRWALKGSALLGGIGIGLFIDEVGKFITQANDYFFPPALSIIYGFFLLTVFAYFHIRRLQMEHPRQALYHAFEGLQDALDSDLDTDEADRIEAQLALAKQSDRHEIAALADAISDYLQEERHHLVAAEPSLWKRTTASAERLSRRLGRSVHRATISALLMLWVALAVGYIVTLVNGSANLDRQVVQWRGVLIAIQSLSGGLTIIAAVAWLSKREGLGLTLAISGSLLSLVALQ
ncbi:MAG TPA: hypothetical protein VM537_28255, partial [Anaerolineae bacterium]|nr:hypothetical protein [Anaerolineae bacterium]